MDYQRVLSDRHAPSARHGLRTSESKDALRPAPWKAAQHVKTAKVAMLPMNTLSTPPGASTNRTSIILLIQRFFVVDILFLSES